MRELGTSAPVSVLLLDGAEAVQEGSSGALEAMLAAAAEAGVTPVLVLRDDAHGSVMELVQAGGGAAPAEFVVAPLTDAEIETVVGDFFDTCTDESIEELRREHAVA